MTEIRRKDGTVAHSEGAARGYKWADAEPGNLLALRHGARSERIVAAKAAAVRDKLLCAFPYLAEVVFAEAVERYCRAESRALLLHNYVMAEAEEKGVAAVPRSLWQEAARAESNAAKFASDCGLDAAGHSRIARDLGVARSVGARLSGEPGLADIGASGRKLRQLRRGDQ
ncbi:MAG: hypothetical protein ACYCSF_13170 [Acidimicrobiales bacterium]